MNYDQMTDDEFDQILKELMNESFTTPDQMLLVTGIYEIMSEFFNNEVLDRWAERQPEAEIDEDDFRE